MDNQERNREALVDHIAAQDRILRRRNEQIARQAKQIENQSRNAEEDQRAIEAIEADLADYQAMHSEQMKTIARLQKNPRPLTADDITDEMVQRGDQAWSALRNPENTFPRLIIETIIRAALTPPPDRPEGAEELEALIDRASLDGEDADNESLADYLAARLTDPTVKEQS